MMLRRGYALADFLTTVAIAAIAIALFLPAIQQMREAARSEQCNQRLQQIGLKSHNYEAIFNRLPCQLGATGTIDWNDWINSASVEYYLTKQNVSPLCLLAIVDGAITLDPQLYDINEYNLESPIWQNSSYLTAVYTQLPDYLCPSEFHNQTTEFHVLAVQPVYLSSPQQDDSLGQLIDNSGGFAGSAYTSFSGCLGASTGGAQRAPSDLWQYRGMITSRETVTTAQVAASDGLANTIMFGENIGTSDEGNITERFSLITGGISRGRGEVAWMDPGTPENPLLGRPLASSVFGFGSAHSSGVGFVFGDASVSTITRDIDMLTYYALCGAFDTD